MLSDSFLQTNFAGRDGFTWWIGKVARPEFWRNIETVQSQSNNKGHRVKVRIIGYHPWDVNELPEDDLPWADVLSDPTVGNGTLTRGETMALVGGETAVGFFLDGENGQQPVVMGLLHRSGNVATDTISKAEAAANGAGFKNTTPEAPPDPTDRTAGQNALTQTPAAVPAAVAPGTQGKWNKRLDFVENASGYLGVSGLTVEQLFGEGTAAEKKLERLGTEKVQPGAICDDNFIGRITQILTDFIAISNTVEKTLDVYVDPVLNEAVDMTYQVKKFAKRTLGIIKMVLNNIRDGLFGKLNILFSTFLGGINIFNPASFVTTPAAQKGFMKVLAIIFCLFEKLLGEFLKFLENMFQSLLGRVINGPFCAVEQFVQAILAKMMDALEKGLEPILKGLDWLMGGLASVRDVLNTATSLATKIFNFIGCDGRKCTTPSSWISTINGSLEEKRTDWAEQVRGINVFRTANTELSKLERDVDNATTDLFASGDEEYKRIDYKGSNLGSILADVDKLTGGESAKLYNKGLSSMEAAIATSSLFSGKNSIFDACNRRMDNPQTQDDLMPLPTGYQYDFCLPPKVKIRGDGRGAKLRAIIGNRGEIFSIEVVREGKDYTRKGTSLVIVDNSGHGRGAQARPVVKKGKITNVVITSPGRGYCANTPYSDPTAEGDLGGVDTPIDCSTTADCPEGMECINGKCVIPCDVDSDCPPGQICMNGMCVPIPGEPGIGTDVVGIVTYIEPYTPGWGYEDDDDVLIGDDICEECTIGITTGGSIIGIDIGDYNVPWSVQPSVRVLSDTGLGANMIAVMEYRRQYQTDFGSETRRRLVGITSVVDCVGDPPQLVGYVNGREYYGPFHVHPDTGLKMVGERHKSTPHAIIYPTKEQSLGGSTIQIVENDSDVVGPTVTPTTPTPTVTPTTPTSTSTPSININTTDTNNDPPSSTGGGY